MTQPRSRPTPAQKVDDIPLAMAAMRDGLREAMARHKLAGTQMVIWKKGRIVWIEPEDIPVHVEPINN